MTKTTEHIPSGTLTGEFDLSGFNTLAIPSVCKAFGVFTSTQELIQLMDQAKDSKYILGGGSNVLLPSRWNTCVLHNRIMGKKVLDHGLNNVKLRVGAGEHWNAFTRWCVREGYGGVENLALIPGLVGAAPIQNIGAYGVELSDVLLGLYYLDFDRQKVRWIAAEDAKLGYRDSIFKNEWKGRGCVLSVDLRLSKENHRLETSYGALKSWLVHKDIDDPGIADIRRAVIDIRRSKLPDPSELGNSGSFFKNPILDREKVEALRSNFPDMPSYSLDDKRIKVPAGWLIEECGWKGKRVGNVGCYKDQALVIVNYGDATSEEIIEHAGRIRRSVHERFGILLEPEVNIIGQSLP